MKSIGFPRQNPRVFALLGRFSLATFLAAAILTMGSCSDSPSLRVTSAEMGEKVVVEAISYTVLDAQWVEVLGEGADARIPTHRFLQLRIAAANETEAPAEMGAFTLISSSGTEYDEIADGARVAEWLGMARQLDAKATKQGIVLFDAPKAVYRLQVADSFYDGESGSAALIQIPIRPEGGEPAVSGALP